MVGGADRSLAAAGGRLGQPDAAVAVGRRPVVADVDGSAVSACMANNKKFLLLNEPLLPSDIALTSAADSLSGGCWPVRSSRAVGGDCLAGGVGGDGRAFGVRAVAAGAILVLAGVAFARADGDCLLAAARPVVDHSPAQGAARCRSGIGTLPTSVAAGGFFPTFLRCMDNVPRPAVRSMTAAGAKTVLAKKFGETAFPARRPTGSRTSSWCWPRRSSIRERWACSSSPIP